MEIFALKLFLCFVSFVSAGNKFYKMERIGNCQKSPAVDSLTIDFSEFKTTNDPKGFRSEGWITVSKDLKGPLTTKISLKKCISAGIQCDTFYSDTFTNFCPYLAKNMYAAEAFVKMTEPPFMCPLKQGQYNGTNYLIDMSAIDALPFDTKFKWILTLNFYEKDSDDGKLKPLGCWLLQMTRTTVTGARRGKGK